MTSPAAWLIGAALAQGAIAFVLLLVLGTARVPLVVAGKIRMRDVALSKEPWPVRAQQLSNAFDNQFELPVLFYVAIAIAIYLGPTVYEAVLAWAFVVTRAVHAAIHATSNYVPSRFGVFVAGCVLLIMFWVTLTFRLVLTPHIGG